MPDNIYANADVKLTGDPICMTDLLNKHPEDHDPLKEHKNVLGMLSIEDFFFSANSLQKIG